MNEEHKEVGSAEEVERLRALFSPVAETNVKKRTASVKSVCGDITRIREVIYECNETPIGIISGIEEKEDRNITHVITVCERHALNLTKALKNPAITLYHITD